MNPELRREPLSNENIERQRLNAIYDSAILEKSPEGKIKTIRKGLKENGLSLKDLTPELERLFNNSVDEITN